MSDAPYIPRKTLEELTASHPEGTRHAAKIKIAIPLLGNGMAPEAVVAQLMTTFNESTRSENEGVVRWCMKINPAPSVPTNGKTYHNGNGHSRPSLIREPVKELDMGKDACVERAKAWLGAFSCSEAEWWEKSPVQLEDWREDAATLLSAIYGKDEHISIVRQFTLTDKGKANPKGAGKVMLRDDWLISFKTEGVPCTEAGAWMRPNPVKAIGSGHAGAITDADVEAFRFCLLESDAMPMDMQLSFYAKLKLPVSVIMMSGGKSVHAWVRLDMPDKPAYDKAVAEIFGTLAKFGIDAANKNAGRLSRLPGVPRKIQASEDGRQRLIYLNPDPGKFDLEAFKAEMDSDGLVMGCDMVGRVLDYMKPKPPPFTLPIFAGKDADHGFYFRESEVTIWSGVSGHGKSSMLMTIMLALLSKRTPFFVCSLEYKTENLCVLMAHVANGRKPDRDEVENLLRISGNLVCFADFTGGIEPQNLLALMRKAHRKMGARHFFIDSLMRVNGLTEDYPAQNEFLTDLQIIAKTTAGHVHLVGHPRKVDEDARVRKADVKGSMDIVNNADNVVTMRRNQAKKKLQEDNKLTVEKAKTMHDAEFAVEKQRETGWEGVFKLSYDPFSRAFTEFKEKTVKYTPPTSPEYASRSTPYNDD